MTFTSRSASSHTEKKLASGREHTCGRLLSHLIAAYLSLEKFYPSSQGETAHECLIGAAVAVKFSSIILARLRSLPPESQQVLVIPNTEILNSTHDVAFRKKKSNLVSDSVCGGWRGSESD